MITCASTDDNSVKLEMKRISPLQIAIEVVNETSKTLRICETQGRPSASFYVRAGGREVQLYEVPLAKVIRDGASYVPTSIYIAGGKSRVYIVQLDKLVLVDGTEYQIPAHIAIQADLYIPDLNIRIKSNTLNL